MMKWLKSQSQKASLRQYYRGYDYAAGALLRKECGAAEMDSRTDTYIYGDPFDSGIRDAIVKCCSLGIVKDDRV